MSGGIGPVVLVDLEAACAGIEQRLERSVVLDPRAGLEADVDGPPVEAGECALHRPRRLLEAGRDERGHATRQRGRQEGGADRVDVAVDRARGRDQAVAHDRLGVGTDRQLDAVADRAVARPPDADDPPVLDADVRLDRADERVEDERAGDDDIELGRTRAALDRPGSQRLRVAPDRFVARCLAVLGDADPQVGVGQADAIAGARAVACEAIGRGEAGHPGSPDASGRPRPRTARAARSGSRRATSARWHRPGCRGGTRERRRDRRPAGC